MSWVIPEHATTKGTKDQVRVALLLCNSKDASTSLRQDVDEFGLTEFAESNACIWCGCSYYTGTPKCREMPSVIAEERHTWRVEHSVRVESTGWINPMRLVEVVHVLSQASIQARSKGEGLLLSQRAVQEASARILGASKIEKTERATCLCSNLGMQATARFNRCLLRHLNQSLTSKALRGICLSGCHSGVGRIEQSSIDGMLQRWGNVHWLTCKPVSTLLMHPQCLCSESGPARAICRCCRCLLLFDRGCQPVFLVTFA
mmetsp:Transcript_22488/g.30429  ORF Transcript_22488/g.30429 Transcript_22488/m.30429 type:complete len:260 (+) Transcript_22488:424-1203(+)